MTYSDGIIGNLLTLIELGCISMEEQNRFEHSPDLLVAPVFAHDVSCVVFPIQESKPDKSGSNSFLHMMERQGIVSFV